MRCPKCGSDNREGARFCSDCATPLAARCHKCGAENRPGAKFCDSCSAPLNPPLARAASQKIDPDRDRSHAGDGGGDARVRVQESAAPLDGERKTITALFADIKGSMELMEDLDPEEARAIIDPALQLMMEAVHHYGGHVAQSTGDGIFALFGAPIAHEDHPQRALHAALRMQADIKRHAARLREQGRAPLQIRVGVNTGEVVVRSLRKDETHEEYLPVGVSTGLAQRMQSLADPGSIVVADRTHKLTEGYFTFKSLGAANIKGLSEPINVYEVTGPGPLRTRLQAAAHRGLSKFVGREGELEALKRCLAMARSGKGQVVAVMGEAGVGKSRLFDEFKAILQSNRPDPAGGTLRAAQEAAPLVLEALAQSYGKASLFQPLIELLESYFEFAPADDIRRRREKVAGKIVVLERGLEDSLPDVYRLLGIAEGGAGPAQIDAHVSTQRACDAVRRLWLRESLSRTVVVIFEDLHWIDEETEAFLNLVVEGLGASKILLLTNFRPEYRHPWTSKSYCTQLRLDPLGANSAEQMLRGLLGDAPDLKPVGRFIAEKTEGNPFFIEEMVQALFDEGVLARDGEVKQIKPLSELRLPSTVQGILSARIDRLAPVDKEMLQTLSAIGREFGLALVRETSGRAEDELRPVLERLQMAEFIYEQPSIEDVEYIFKHALTQEVAYNSVLAERRKALHERVARGIEKLYSSQLDDHFLDLAYHYSRSGDLARGARFARLAGQRAYFKSQFREAMAQLHTALDLIAKLPRGAARDREEIPVQLVMGLLRIFFDDAPEVAAQHYRRALELAEARKHWPSVVRALFGLESCSLIRGKWQRGREYAERQVQLAERLNDPVMMCEAYTNYSASSGSTNALNEALHTAQRALSLRSSLPGSTRFYFADPLDRIQNILASILYLLGFADQARKVFDSIEQPTSVRSSNLSLISRAAAFRLLRDPAGTREVAERAIRLSREQGLTRDFVRATALRAWALVTLGEVKDVASFIDSIEMPLRSVSYNVGALDFAEMYGYSGKIEKGLTIVDDVVRVETRLHFLGEAHRVKAELLLSRDSSSSEEAERNLREAIACQQKCGAKSYELRATVSLARLLAKQGQREEARTMLAEIYNWFTEGFDTADLKDARLLLDELSG